MKNQQIVKEKREQSKKKFGIDRDVENDEILKYQIEGNERLFEKIYARRIPTIQYLAKKYVWLAEDSFSEINMVFVRTVNNYGTNGKKTDFNTFFYSSVINHFANVAKKKFRKKRTTIEDKDPECKTIPLDGCYNDDSNCFHELIASPNGEYFHNIELNDYITEICSGNEKISAVLLSMIDLSKRQVMRQEIKFVFDFCYITGDIIEDVNFSLNIPEKCFVILDVKTNGEYFSATILFDNKKIVDYFAKQILEKRVFSNI